VNTTPAPTEQSSPGLPDAAGPELPFRDPSRPLAERVEDLLGRLTRDERLAMLHQYVPSVPRLGLGAFRTGTEALHGVAWLGPATTFPQAVGLGATWDEELVREVAAAVATEQRAFHHHHSPQAGTGPHSLQAWAPVVNLLRDPRWGRNEEGYSEDPVHTGRLGEAFCRGMTGDHPVYLRAAPVLKHFLAYNNEDDRCTTSSGLRPRVLHEYDLAAFRPAIARGAATGVMAAYNLVNGRPCHVSPLIGQELRRWAEPTGHELFVVSDAGAPTNLVDPEAYFDDHVTSHAAALRAGIDSFTDHDEDSSIVVGRLREALDRGLLSEADIDKAVYRQLELRFRLGEFDPDLDPYAATGWGVVDSPEHRALSLRAATESIVLLKNDGGLLPLDPPAGRGNRVAVIGPLADTLYEDWYSGTMPYRVTVADGLEAAVGQRGGTVVRVEGVDRIALRIDGCAALLSVPAHDPDGPLLAGDGDRQHAAFDVFDWGEGILTMRSARTGRYVGLRDEDAALVADRIQPGGWDVHEIFRLEPQEDGSVLLRSALTGRYAAVEHGSGRVVLAAETPDAAVRWQREVLRDGVAEAVAEARAADTVVVVLGNDPHINGRETQDRTGLALPPAQESLLRAVASERPETVLVLMSSYPYALDWAEEHVPAVLWTSHGGQETGRAVSDVLLGAADPAGRLPQTWYRGSDPLPDPLDYDIIKAGWTYQYHRTAPLYPFGHGLSYTDFAYRELTLTQGEIAPDGTVDVHVRLANTGDRPGVETVQIYTRAKDARYDAPLMRLADFAKLRLAAGQEATAVFTLRADEALAHWDVDKGGFTVDPGHYEVVVSCGAGRPLLSAALTVTGPAPGARTVVGRRVLARDFDDHRGIAVVDADRADGDAVAPAGPAAALVVRAANLTGARQVQVEVSRTAPGEALLELWAGPPAEGVRLAAVPVPSTGDRYAWAAVEAPLAASVTGVHDLHLVLAGEQRLRAFTLGG
jgi:beta-glucosidase